jgi:hypothetical protein
VAVGDQSNGHDQIRESEIAEELWELRFNPWTYEVLTIYFLSRDHA